MTEVDRWTVRCFCCVTLLVMASRSTPRPLSTRPPFSERLYATLHNPESRWFYICNDVLAVATIVSVLALILETVPALSSYTPLFSAIEYVAVVLFATEYVARLISRKGDRLRYIFSFFGIIDLISILPTIFGLSNFTFLKTARILRILRLLRMARIAKLSHLSHLSHVRGATSEHQSMYGQALFIYFSALMSSVVIFGTLLYLTESAQSYAESIPYAMIWAIKIIMGGISQPMPLTTSGELVVIGARFVGLALFGLLISLIGDSMRKLLFGDGAPVQPAAVKKKAVRKVVKRKVTAKVKKTTAAK